MSSSADFDRTLSAWLDDLAPLREPEGLTDAVMARTRRTRRLPGWVTLERWLPMQTTYRFGAVPRAAIILATLALLTAFTAAAIALGSSPGPSPKLPLPTGAARNGVIAFDDDGDIYVVNPEDSSRKALTTGPRWDTNPVWSLDGTRIAFWSQPTLGDAVASTNGSWALHVMDAGGTNDTTLVDGLTLSRWSTSPAWSYDGTKLAYSDEDLGVAPPNVRIEVISSAGGTPVLLASSGQDPTWSPDGKWIAYQGGAINADHSTTDASLSVIGSDGKDLRGIAHFNGQTQYTFSFPQWSPDGLQLAYQSFGNGGRDIFVASLDGKHIGAIAAKPTDENWPTWSPDGTRIAYDGPSGTPGMSRIALVDPDGTNQVTLDHPPLGCGCRISWAPDGTIVAAYKDGPIGHEDTGGSMLLVDASGKKPPVEIPYHGLSNQQVSWQRLAP